MRGKTTVLLRRLKRANFTMRSACNFVPGTADFILPQTIPMADKSR
jgi:hypothetical protein